LRSCGQKRYRCVKRYHHSLASGLGQYRSLFGIALLILVIIIFLAVALFVIRNVVQLIIDAIIVLLTPFVVNFFHLMQYAGNPDIGYDIITILICAPAGLPGAILIIVLVLIGITV